MRTAYFREDWGFSITHEQLQTLEEGEYEVCIDSTLEPGHLTYGEYLLPGRDSGRSADLHARLPSFALQ